MQILVITPPMQRSKSLRIFLNRKGVNLLTIDQVSLAKAQIIHQISTLSLQFLPDVGAEVEKKVTIVNLKYNRLSI